MSPISKSIEISAPREKVLGVVLDVERYPDWQREVQKITVEQQDEQGRPLTTKVDVKAMGQSGYYRVRYEYPDADTVSYHLTEGDMMTKNDATFAVADKGRGVTQLTVGMDLALKWPLPAMMVNQLIIKGVKDMLKSVKKQAEGT